MQVSPLFEENIKKWVTIDNKIKQANDIIKTLKQDKNNVGEYIIQYIKLNKLENHHIGINNGGKIKLAVSESVEPLTKKYIEEKLTAYFKSNSKAKEIIEVLYSNRVKKQREYVSCTKGKSSI